MKYYCEPWEVDFDSSHDGIYAIDDNGGTDIATVWGMKDDGSEVSKRIVDCVNACAGMEKPAEEIARLKSEAEKWERMATLACEEKHKAVDEVGRLRAELEASKNNKHFYCNGTMGKVEGSPLLANQGGETVTEFNAAVDYLKAYIGECDFSGAGWGTCLERDVSDLCANCMAHEAISIISKGVPHISWKEALKNAKTRIASERDTFIYVSKISKGLNRSIEIIDETLIDIEKWEKSMR